MNAPEAPPFDEPWQAQVFAIVVTLNERGLFTWSEWARRLGAEIAAGPREAGSGNYFLGWLRALEKILADKGVASEGALADLVEAWRVAALATPHGMPIVLRRDVEESRAGHGKRGPG